MALSISFAHTSGEQLCFAIKQGFTGLWYDFAPPPAAGQAGTGGTFCPAPARKTDPLPESAGPDRGSYDTVLESTPQAEFLDGGYTVRVYDKVRLDAGESAVVDNLAAEMFQGSDQPIRMAAILAAAQMAVAEILTGQTMTIKFDQVTITPTTSA